MIRNLLLAILLVAAEVVCGRYEIAVAQPVNLHKEQDGIAAELSITPADALVRWRFLKRLPKPLDEVTATLNGRPLGVPTIAPYPAVGQITAVIALLDVSGLQRQQQIDRFKAAMLLLVTRKAAHQQIAFAVYALEGSLLVPQGDDPNEIISLLRQIPALDQEGNLSGALVSSMRTLQAIAADRRAIYVFTDGHNDGSVPLGELAELAGATGVTLTFLVAPSDRPTDLPALARLVETTGGQLVREDDIDAFLAEPFALLDSGAQLRFPLNSARQLFWEPGAAINVVFRYGDRQMEIGSAAPVSAGTMTDTVAYVLLNHPTGVWGAGGAIIAIAGAALVALTKRQRRATSPDRERPAVPGALPAILATLEDIEDGKVFSLKLPLTRIGRSGENDIVLDEATVGRFHAIVQQIADRGFSIQDQASANGTWVNDRKVDTATLSDGDIIMFGSKTLQFKGTAHEALIKLNPV